MTTPLPDLHPMSDTTRGRLLALVREAPRSVSDLTEELDVTPTAVRKHIDGLRADRFVEERGTRKGMGRPATLYGLTDEGEALFLRGHESILGAVFAAVRDEVGPRRQTAVLRGAGAHLARRMLSARGELPPEGFDASVQVALTLLRDLGGREQLREADPHAEILGFSCPLGEYVEEFPECCELIAGFLQEVLGVPVEEKCPREGDPLCVLEARLEG